MPASRTFVSGERERKQMVNIERFFALGGEEIQLKRAGGSLHTYLCNFVVDGHFFRGSGNTPQAALNAALESAMRCARRAA
jgi:hypothetical protein